MKGREIKLQEREKYIEKRGNEFEKMLILSAIYEKNGDISQILPYILYKDKFDRDDDIIKMMLGASIVRDNYFMKYLMIDMLMAKRRKRTLSILTSNHIIDSFKL